jgi:nucleoside-diphosphate-sugar epimerase
MRVLITGASGLIGRATCAELVARGDTVFALTRGDAPDGCSPVNIDLSAPWSEAQLPDHVDAVVHLAQSPDYRDFPGSARGIFDVNLLTTARLLDWSRSHGVQHFALASSGGLYAPSDTPLTEDAPLALSGPLAYYLATKRAAELLTEPYAGLFGVSISRIFFAYGPGQKASFLIPSLIRSIREGRSIKLAGYEGLVLNPIAAQDVACALIALLPRRGTTLVNLAGSEVVSLRRLTTMLGDALGIAPHYEVDAAAKQPRVVADISRMRDVAVAPTRRLEETLREVVRSEV